MPKRPAWVVVWRFEQARTLHHSSTFWRLSSPWEYLLAFAALAWPERLSLVNIVYVWISALWHLVNFGELAWILSTLSNLSEFSALALLAGLGLVVKIRQKCQKAQDTPRMSLCLTREIALNASTSHPDPAAGIEDCPFLLYALSFILFTRPSHPDCDELLVGQFALTHASWSEHSLNRLSTSIHSTDCHHFFSDLQKLQVLLISNPFLAVGSNCRVGEGYFWCKAPYLTGAQYKAFTLEEDSFSISGHHW